VNKHLDRWFTVVLILLLAACLLLTVEDLLVYAASYDVKIDARDSENEWIAVRIAMNGVDTGFDTPHTFMKLSGTNTFTVPNANSYGNLFSMWSTRWTSTTLTVSSGGTYIADYYPEVPHDVTIQAWEATRGALESVSIIMDNLATEFTTPHTFVDLTGTHSFTVPDKDSFGVPFGDWEETGWTNATITVSGGGGTHTARYYYPPYNATILGWDSVHGGLSEPLTKDGSPAGLIPQSFTNLAGRHNFTVPGTNSYGNLFTGWDKGEMSNTISVILNGTYIAYYAPAPSPTPSPSPSPSPTPTPIPTPSPTPTSASPTPNPTPSSQPTSTPTPTKTPNPTAKPSSTPGPTEGATFALPVEAFFAFGTIAIVVVVIVVIFVIRKKEQKKENRIV
jgi:hypothetical protein